MILPRIQTLFYLQDTGVFEEYWEQMKKIYPVNTGLISKADQIFIGLNVVISILLIGLFCYWLMRVFTFLAATRTARANLADTDFWVRMGAAGLILFLVMSGSILVLFEQLYNLAIENGWST
ncbi:hypothetical protein [Paenibacillus bovis]|uniref:Uncharacterized protein n=1 Tax=Paenibacillus bovis TaxID=1616788 RepID=A0A1X9T4D9_9BACL|nr:hypothetical protein [Paenibacillus bovis]ARR10726.1 hypothetical protein AR543_p0118 [Paenibacillus bovis]